MKKLATSFLIAMCGGGATAQPVVDIGLVHNDTDSVLEFYLRPSIDYGGVVSSLSFTLRWAVASSDTLGPRQQFCAAAFSISPSPMVTQGDYHSRTFSAFGTSLLSDEGCTWSACEEHLVMIAPVSVDGGFGPFEIVGGTYVITLGDTVATGILFTIGDPCLSTAMISTPRKDRRELLTMFPNPATDLLSITLPQGLPLPAMLDMIAVDGRIIRSAISPNGTVDIRSLLPGLYAARVPGFTGWFVKR